MLSTAAHAATPGTFTTLASSPNPINNVVVDPTTNIIYAQQTEGTGFYSYNPATNTWKTLTSAPLNQENNGGAAYVNGKIYTFYSQNDTQIGIYDIATGTWTTAPYPLGSQAGAYLDDGTADVTSAGGLIYIAEGDEFASYDPATGETTSLATPPDFADGNCWSDGKGAEGNGFSPWGALASYNGMIYGTQGDGCDGFAVYDIATNSWKELPLVPNSTALGGAIDPLTGTYYAYGPYSGDDFDAYDIAAGEWTTTTFPSPITGDGGMAYVPVPGLQGIYATYGEDATGFTRYNTLVPPDLSITETASPEKVVVGHTFTYTVDVTNSSTTSADGTTVTDPLPGQVKLVKATPSQGTCTGTTTVSCALGTLAGGSSATVVLEVQATATGAVNDTATAADTNSSASTSASVTVTIVKPTSNPKPKPNPKRRKLGLRLSPRTATAGRRTCFRLVVSSAGKRVRGARVSFAGHSARTSKRGVARLCMRLAKGTYRARATKTGYRAASAVVRVRRASPSKH